MRIRSVGATDLREKFAQCHARFVRVFESEACFEIGLRLAPELRPHTKRSECAQQQGIVAVRRQPALRLRKLFRWLRRAAIRVLRDEIGRPMPLEASRQDVRRLAIAAQHGEAFGRGAGDLGKALFGVRQLAPVGAQPCRIVRPGLELLRMRRRPQIIAFLRSVRLAPHELIDQRGNFTVTPRALQRAQLEPQRRRVRARLLFQCLELRQRFERPPLLQVHLGVEHQTRDCQAARLHGGSGEVRFGRREVARVERCPRRHQRDEPGRSRDGEAFLRELTCLAIASFEQRDDSGIELRPCASFPLPAPELPDVARQRRHAQREPQQRIAADKAADHEQQHEIERQLDAIRRRDEQHIAVDDLCGERNAHRRGGEQQEPEQDPHGLAHRRRAGRASGRAILRETQYAQCLEAARKIGHFARERRCGELL